MSKGKLDATQQRASTSTDPSCGPDTDCFELVLENGQIMTRGQSSKARKNPVSNNFQNFIPKTFDVRNANGSKMAKLSSTDCVSADFPLPVPSCEMGLDQDVGMVSWMNNHNEDSLHNDYNSDFLHELSGVTINNLSTRNHLASRGKKSSINGDGPRNTIDSVVSMKHGDLDKAPWVAEKHTRNGSSEVLHFPLPLENVVPGSDICDASGSNTGATHHVTSRDSVCNPSSLCAFTSLRLQKLNAGQPSTSFTNFSNFVRPRSNPSLNKLDHDDDKRCTLSSSNHAGSSLVNISSVCSPKVTFSHNQSVLAPVNVNSVPLPAKPTEKLLSSDQAVFREDVAKNDASQNPARMVGETNMEMEPVVATSSVCSGNNVERASNEGAQDLKRKSCETGESEDPSEELEDESVGARKASPARTGTKRIKAAEVHNLSERRRRDRINERMRALQELIPNCNKVDKASMLDEAIEYLKTLQLQVQILSMGAGLHMQPMMLPGMQPIHGSHMPHFSHMGFGMGMGMGTGMGVGMGVGMGYGMNMLDANIGMKMMPFQAPQYLIPVGTAFQGMPGSSLQALGHPGQGLPVSMPRAPLLPVSGVPPLKIPVGPHVLGAAGPTDAAHLAPSSSSMAVGPQVLPSHNVNSFVGQASNQAASKGIECSVTSHDTSGTDTMPS